MTGDQPLILHASCVALGEKGLLILGPSGCGKSSLALQMIALGAELVADDRVEIRRAAGALIATCPAATRGLIEARGVGLLRAPTRIEVALALAVDLARTEVHRLPERHEIVYLGQALALVNGAGIPHLPASLLLYLAHGREA